MEKNRDEWVAAVQLRQNVSHCRTFFYLEQLILKHDAAAHCVRITQMPKGIDFFFADRSHAVKFVKFIAKVTPMKCRHHQQFVSHDVHTNTDNFRFTFSIEISPVCREDLICLPPSLAKGLGNIGPLVISTQVTDSIALLDPHTLRHSSLDSRQYWSSSFKSLLSSRQLVDYLILQVEPLSFKCDIRGSKYALSDACVARVSDFRKNSMIFYARTHLGDQLSPGDRALGYDLHGNNYIELKKYKRWLFPEVVLIKKSYEEKRRGKPRSWKLKSLEMEVDESAKGKDDEEKRSAEYEQFLRDLEENREMRVNVSLYRNKEYQPSEIAEGDDVPYIASEELLDD